MCVTVSFRAALHSAAYTSPHKVRLVLKRIEWPPESSVPTFWGKNSTRAPTVREKNNLKIQQEPEKFVHVSGAKPNYLKIEWKIDSHANGLGVNSLGICIRKLENCTSVSGTNLLGIRVGNSVSREKGLTRPNALTWLLVGDAPRTRG